MTDEVLFHHGTTMVRRLRLARPLRPCRGIEITPGEVEWEEPTERVHRAVNVGEQTYEQVTAFLLDSPDAEPQPSEE